MTPRRTLFAALAIALSAGVVAPAVAAAGHEQDTKRLCVALSSDPEKAPTAPVCIWLPIHGESR